MSGFIRGNATKRCLCRWKCVHCGEIIVGLATINATASQKHSIFISKETASEKVQAVTDKEIAKAIRTVNEKHIVPKSVSLSGKCAKCGKLQPWFVKELYWIPRTILSIIISLFLFSFIMEFSMTGAGGKIVEFLAEIMGGGFIITIMLLSIGVSEVLKLLIEFISLKKSGGDRVECYPELIDLSSE